MKWLASSVLVQPAELIMILAGGEANASGAFQIDVKATLDAGFSMHLLVKVPLIQKPPPPLLLANR